MKNYELKTVKQLELLENMFTVKNTLAKRVNIVSLKLVKESSLS